jgi:hypothetical protein
MAVGAEDTVETDTAGGAERGGDGPVRQAAGNGEGIALGRNDSATLENSAQAFDVGSGPVGEVAQGALRTLPSSR